MQGDGTQTQDRCNSSAPTELLPVPRMRNMPVGHVEEEVRAVPPEAAWSLQMARTEELRAFLTAEEITRAAEIINTWDNFDSFNLDCQIFHQKHDFIEGEL